jgi:hypothetical protein
MGLLAYHAKRICFSCAVVIALCARSEDGCPFGAQCHCKLHSSKACKKAVSPELGFVFHQIECLSQCGLICPDTSNVDFSRKLASVLGSHRISSRPCPPWPKLNSFKSWMVFPPQWIPLVDPKPFVVSWHASWMRNFPCPGTDFVSVNQFISGSSPSSQFSTRALALDLACELFSKDERKSVRFLREVPQRIFCRETRLRAWNAKSKGCEAIMQRKIVTSLPQMLTLACSCAGRKEEDGLWAWRTDEDGRQRLPEIVEPHCRQ